MKLKRILVGLSSLAVVCGFVGLTNSNASYDSMLLGKKTSYIVELKDGENITTYAFKQHLNDTLGYGNYSITDTFKGSLLNGFEVVFNSNYYEKIESFDEVENVYLCNTYAMPEAYATSSSGSEGDSSDAQPKDTTKSTTSYSRATMRIQDEGIDAPAKQGEGITIGIIDTGLFFTQVAETASDPYEEKAFRPLDSSVQVKYTKEDIEKLKSDNASTTLKNGKYVNNKIIWEYDYADEDDNVSPSYGSEHGTHVASLATANGLTYEGAAPNAQLAVFKVFSSSSSGATDAAILHALQDCDTLGIDVINLSLGTALIQNSTSTTDDLVYAIVDKLEAKGAQVNFAAGNDSRSSYNKSTLFFADTQNLDTVESSVLGGYSLLSSPNHIASSYLDKSYHKKLVVGNQSTSFTDQNTDYPISSLFETGTTSYQYVFIDNTGAESDYENIGGLVELNDQGNFLNPTIAVVNRGDITFVEKATAAQKHGAKALIIVNNQAEDGGRFDISTGATDPIVIPVVSVPKEDGAKVFGAAGTTGYMSYDDTGVLEDNDNAKHASYFTSEGPTTLLGFNPDIAAPGTDILGAVNGEYESMSGTSMASPNFTGALATILSNHLGDSEYNEHVMARIQSTATPLHDDSLLQISEDHIENGAWAAATSASETNIIGAEDYDANSQEYNYASPRRIGAGMINVEGALNNKVWLETPTANATSSNLEGTGSAKIELGYNGDITEGKINFSFIAHNETGKDQTYEMKLYVAVPEARYGILGSDIESSSISTDMLAKGLSTTYMQSTDDHMIAFDTLKTVTVPANGGIIEVSKDYSNDARLTDYVNRYYETCGTYLEGYVVLVPTGETAQSEDTDTNLRIPYIGFYGDYGNADAVEKFDFERTDNSTLNSDVVASIAHNISGGSENADFGSQIYATDREEYTSLDAQAALIEIASGTATVEDKDFAKLGTDTKGNRFDTTSTSGVVAGIEGKSDLLVIKQFVNRSLYNAKVSLKDADGNTLHSSWMMDYYYSKDDDDSTGTNTTNMKNEGDNGYQLIKSFVTESFISARIYSMPATATIPLTDSSDKLLPAGTYTLQFDYTLLATKDGTANGEKYTQTKTVTVTIPEKASTPGITSYGRVGNSFVIFVNDETKYVRFAATDTEKSVVNSVTEYMGQRYVIVPSSASENGYTRGTLVGQDGNNTDFIIDEKGDGNFAIIGSRLSNISLFMYKTTVVAANNEVVYTPYAYDSTGKAYSNFTRYEHGALVNVQAGLSIKEVRIYSGVYGNSKVTYETIDTYSYDEETGQLFVSGIPGGYISISIVY